MSEEQTLRMILPPTRLPVFFPLLQQGVWLQAEIGCGVMSLLAGQFGVAEDYVTERITTLFLDGKAIDDLETSYIKDGSTLALSSAMPGLVGTTMRRGGHLAAMRGTITYQGRKPERTGPGRVKIKLFNMVMAELGETFLSQGIYLSNPELGRFLCEQEDSFRKSFGVIILGEQQIDSASLNSYVRSADPSGEMLVRIEFMD
jgi:hypothetical protein